MSKDQMYLRLDSIPRFEADAQYPPFVHADPVTAQSRMPGIAVFNQAVLAAVARGKEFDATAVTGVESFKQITRRCGAEYAANDVQEATNIARTAASNGDQGQLIDIVNTNRRLYPLPNGE